MQRYHTHTQIGTLIKRNLILGADKIQYFLQTQENVLVGDTIQFQMIRPAETGKLAAVQLVSIVKRGRTYYLAIVIGYKGPHFLVKLFGSDFVFMFPKDSHWFTKGSKHLVQFNSQQQLVWVKSLLCYSNDEIIRYCFTLEDNLCNEKPRNANIEAIDQTHLTTFTIDPIQSKDFDDAISIDADLHKIYIHIADVSRFVSPTSHINQRLYEQQFSVYGTQHTYHMCPDALATDLCSLVPNQLRFACTIECKYDPHTLQLDPFSAKHYRSKIISKRRYHYDEVDTLLTSDAEENSVLHLMKGIYMKNKLKKRFEESQVSFIYSDGNVNISLQKEDDSHAIVEFYMLFANQYVAAYLQAMRKPCIRRVHPTPKHLEKMEEIRLLPLPEGTPESFRTFLLLKCLSAAYYSATDSGHWALGMSDYTHFTSPIRRYVDIVVHRCLFEEGYTTKELEEICSKANEMETRNRQIEEMQTGLRHMDIAKEWQTSQKTLTCIVYSMFVAGFYVYITECGATLPMYISEVAAIYGEYFSFHQQEKAWKSSSHSITMFTTLQCKVKNVIDRIELQVIP